MLSELNQALVNIIDNAYDAGFQKSPNHSDDYISTISLTTQDLGEVVEISICDNGVGVSSDLQPQIFQPFITTKLPGAGTGLGLSITHDIHDIIVGKHKGELRFVTKIGCYTKFIITLSKKHQISTSTSKRTKSL